jgi:hypothetical protein
MKTTSIAIIAMISMIEYGIAYDNELLDYYSSNKPKFAVFEESAGKEDPDGNNHKKEKIRPKISKYPYSIKQIESENILGYYVVSDLNPKFYPFTQIFSDSEIDQLVGGYNKGGLIYQLNITRPTVVELYDADVNTENLDFLSNVDSIEHLGLPRRGLVFTKSFKLPSRIRTLVIRNTTINSYVIKALSNSNHIENLILIDCGLAFGTFQSRGTDFLNAWWGEEPRIFEDVSTKLKKIKIINSDPDFFNFIARERWTSLEQLQITLFPSNILAASYLARENIKSVFPNLKMLTVTYYGDMYPYFKSELMPKEIKIVNQ